ncbi:DUF2180 family protein [Streptomyces decoyicus]
MNCYDCTPTGNAAAVAICRNCGAALCHRHAWSAPQTVTRVQGVGRRAEHTAGPGTSHRVQGLPGSDTVDLSEPRGVLVVAGARARARA